MDDSSPDTERQSSRERRTVSCVVIGWVLIQVNLRVGRTRKDRGHPKGLRVNSLGTSPNGIGRS